MAISRAAIIVLLLTGVHGVPAAAGVRVYPLFELTDQQAAMVDVTDGSIADWLAVVGEPTLTAADFTTVRVSYSSGDQPTEELHDPHDLDFRMWLAWQASTSRIYIAMERADDVWVNDFNRGHQNFKMSTMRFHDGSIEVIVDADRSGEPIWVNGESVSADFVRLQRQAQYYWVLPQVYDSGRRVQLPDEQHLTVLNRGSADWLLSPPYAEAGGSVWGERPTMSVTEVYLTAFNRLIWSSETMSEVAPLEPGQTVGLCIGVVDRDDGSYEAVPYYRLGQLSETWGTDTCVDALLLGPYGLGAGAPRMEVETWSRVKAAFLR